MHKIALIIENSRAYGRAMIEGIAAFAQESHDWVLRPLSVKDAFTPHLREFSGVIARIADDKLANRLLRSGLPTVDVFCQRSRPGIAGVDSDNRAVGRLAREFFRTRGFANTAFCGISGAAFSATRGEAFADSATFVYADKSQKPIDDSQFFDERIDRIPDAKGLREWVLSLPKPIAIFCCNDLRAIQLQHVALGCGFRIPQDLALLGVDNDTIACSFANVPISSVNPNAFKVGYDAARVLHALLVSKPVRRPHKIHCVKPSGITERASTEFMPIEPPWLGKVLMHIEKNMRHPIPASEIFALAERSGTFVENVFKAKLGLPVQAYITTVKMREAKRLLKDPALRISEVANLCGFSSPQYFCRTFAACFGASPKSYRAASAKT